MKRSGLFGALRGICLFCLFLSFFFIAGFRLAKIQVKDHEKYSEIAKSQQLDEFVFFAKRGSIFDRNGETLAISTDQVTIFANPYLVTDPQGSAQKIAAITGQDVDFVFGKLSDKSRGFVYIARKIPPYMGSAIKELHLDGIYLTPESKRFYPNSELAAQTIGFVGTDNVGLAGVELYYEEILHGKDQHIVAEKDASGRALLFSDAESLQPKDGADLYLSLDASIQFFAEEVIKDAVQSSSAKRGLILVMDPDNGEIYAIACYPSFDLNSFSTADEESMRNLATTFSFEPGSMIKPVIVSIALEKGVISPSDVFHLPPRIKVADRTISEPLRRNTVDYAVSDIVANSSNVGAVMIGMKVGPEKLYQGLSEFGFGDATGVDLPGEEKGIVPRLRSWSGSTIGTVPIGQGISVTPLQMASAVSAIANGGWLVQPHVALKSKDESGNVCEFGWSERRRRVISPGTAAEVASMMHKVVESGTGKEASVPGYAVAGKTGTAQKVDSDGVGYSEGRLITSFIGFAPLRDPRLLVEVVLDEPRPSRGEVWGGTTAAPAFSKVMEFALSHLKVAPDSERTGASR